MKPVSFFDASFFDETNAADVVPLSVVVDDVAGGVSLGVSAASPEANTDSVVKKIFFDDGVKVDFVGTLLIVSLVGNARAGA